MIPGPVNEREIDCLSVFFSSTLNPVLLATTWTQAGDYKLNHDREQICSPRINSLQLNKRVFIQSVTIVTRLTLLTFV
jgi:hypothetical protein